MSRVNIKYASGWVYTLVGDKELEPRKSYNVFVEYPDGHVSREVVKWGIVPSNDDGTIAHRPPRAEIVVDFHGIPMHVGLEEFREVVILDG